jgi:hypothetical protein
MATNDGDQLEIPDILDNMASGLVQSLLETETHPSLPVVDSDNDSVSLPRGWDYVEVA